MDGENMIEKCEECELMVEMVNEFETHMKNQDVKGLECYKED